MAQQTQRGRIARSGNGIAELPAGRPLMVRASDGTRLHTEIFGPDDGYPIVLSHGITCALRVWFNQIADLAVDHRVIAFDHRGHGRSEVPGRHGYTLDHLAGDLNAVLDATLRPGERAVTRPCGASWFFGEMMEHESGCLGSPRLKTTK